VNRIYSCDEAHIKQLFVGRRVVAADLEQQTLTLDDGTIYDVEGNEGGCSCGNGDYDITALNVFDNVITNCEIATSVDGWGNSENVLLFVYAAGGNSVELIRSEGYDNGYYGTGFSIKVRLP